MKKSLLLLAILAMAASFSGCEICADCTCVSTPAVANPTPVTTVDEVCGRKEINNRRGWSSVKVTTGNKTVTVNTHCDCK